MKKAIFRLRNIGIIITEVDECHNADNIARRMITGGFIVGRDALWGKKREVVINLKDIVYVILEEDF